MFVVTLNFFLLLGSSSVHCMLPPSKQEHESADALTLPPPSQQDYYHADARTEWSHCTLPPPPSQQEHCHADARTEWGHCTLPPPPSQQEHYHADGRTEWSLYTAYQASKNEHCAAEHYRAAAIKLLISSDALGGMRAIRVTAIGALRKFWSQDWVGCSAIKKIQCGFCRRNSVIDSNDIGDQWFGKLASRIKSVISGFLSPPVRAHYFIGSLDPHALLIWDKWQESRVVKRKIARFKKKNPMVVSGEVQKLRAQNLETWQTHDVQKLLRIRNQVTENDTAQLWLWQWSTPTHTNLVGKILDSRFESNPHKQICSICFCITFSPSQPCRIKNTFRAPGFPVFCWMSHNWQD